MDLTNLLTDFSSLLLTYIDELRFHYQIKEPQDITIASIRQIDTKYLVTIKFRNITRLIPLLNEVKAQFEQYLFKLLYSLRNKYNLKHVTFILNWDEIQLTFGLEAYPSILLDMPSEMLYHIFEYLNDINMNNLLLSDEILKDKLLKDEFFIYNRLIQTYGNKFPFIKGKIKTMAKNHGKLLYLGEHTKKLLGYKAKSISAKNNRVAFIDFKNNIRIVHLRIESPRLSKHAFKLMSVGQGYVIAIDFNDYIWKIGRKLNPAINTSVKDQQKIIDIGQVPNSKQISCGTNHTLIIDSDNNLWGFGDNTGNQLFGLPRIVSKPTKIDLPFKVKFVACGPTSNMLIDIDDNLWTSGSDGTIGLGVFPRIDVSRQPILLGIKARFASRGELHWMVIDIENNLWGYGSNKHAQIGFPEERSDELLQVNIDIKVKRVACGGSHTLIVDDENDLWGIGRNKNNQLGLPRKHYKVYTKIPLDYKVDDIVCGSGDSLIKILY